MVVLGQQVELRINSANLIFHPLRAKTFPRFVAVSTLVHRTSRIWNTFIAIRTFPPRMAETFTETRSVAITVLQGTTLFANGTITQFPSPAFFAMAL